MTINGARAAAMPARKAAPYPRCSTRTTRAPSFSASSIDPSVEPLSATTISPRRPAERKASMALVTQMPSEFASFKQGMTTDTSTASEAAGLVRLSEFQLAFSGMAIIMAKFRRLPETPQLSNSSELSSQPGASASDAASLSHSTTALRSRGGLLQVLGMWFGIAAAVGNTIAAGIVRAPGDIAQWLPNVYLFFGVWVVGGLYA